MSHVSDTEFSYKTSFISKKYALPYGYFLAVPEAYNYTSHI